MNFLRTTSNIYIPLETNFCHEYKFDIVTSKYALFGLDQLSKFHSFARKSVPMIQTLLSRMEGTIVMKRLKGTCWDLEPATEVVGDDVSLLLGGSEIDFPLFDLI